MRIIAVGIGGAGSRIADSLYATDRKSSKVACVQGLAIDVDEDSMKRLTALPENARMCFSALEPGLPDTSGGEGHAAPIDISEIISRVQNLESGENDAIFLCCGLGGGMADVASHIIAGLRSSVVEPIFGLVTLPCLAEGERISSKAADDIEMLSSLLDGIIVFDNETWYKKIKSQKAHLPPKEKGFAEKLGLKKSEKPLPPAQATYQNLNEALVRRISLILRAGEFKADGGIDLAEVVLDSGEVLNTMKGMGFITIGYAVEKLPHDPLRFLSWLKPAGLFDEEQKKKASRIVELAKQAIYHEISTPCDLTSAHKALVLVAGPSHELSMKGFMTVRKWIDRSIAGLETRSGDYPVMNTKNVAIIVMLSGLENIPRIAELKEIRAQSKPKTPTETGAELTDTEKGLKFVRDDMITVPARKPRDDEAGRKTRSQEEPERHDSFKPPMEPVNANDALAAAGAEEFAPESPEPIPHTTVKEPVPEYIREPSEDFIRGAETQVSSRRRVVVMREETLPAPPAIRDRHEGHRTAVPHMAQPPGKAARNPAGEIPPARETERQRIERELRRQRTVAISGHPQKTNAPERSSHTVPEIRIVKRDSHKVKTTDEKGPAESAAPEPREARTVIIGKRRISAVPQENPAGTGNTRAVQTGEPSSDKTENVVEIRSRVLRARDEVFEGKGVRKPPVPQPRDSTLLHTELRPKKTVAGQEDASLADSREDPAGKDPASAKKRGKNEAKDQDLSWI